MIVDRVRWQLDGWVRRPGGLSGGVTLLRLVPVETRADAGRQLGFWGGQTEADAWAARATARLVGLLGPEAVTVTEERGGRAPGDAYALVSAAVSDVGARSGLDPSVRASAAEPPPWPGRILAPSPATVLADPRPCSVLDAGGSPVRVNGRGMVSSPPAVLVLDGRRHGLVGWAGPWPVEERWWDPGGGSRRARFQLVTDRGEAYLASLQRGEWCIEAIYT
jgi:protein ImuB